MRPKRITDTELQEARRILYGSDCDVTRLDWARQIIKQAMKEKRR